MRDITNFEKAYFEIQDRIECGYNPQHAIEEVTDQMNLTEAEYKKMYSEFKEFL